MVKDQAEKWVGARWCGMMLRTLVFILKISGPTTVCRAGDCHLQCNLSGLGDEGGEEEIRRETSKAATVVTR